MIIIENLKFNENLFNLINDFLEILMNVCIKKELDKQRTSQTHLFQKAYYYRF